MRSALLAALLAAAQVEAALAVRWMKPVSRLEVWVALRAEPRWLPAEALAEQPALAELQPPPADAMRQHFQALQT